MKFEHLKIYCFMTGYRKTGHTLIGCLLDAHPNMIFPNQGVKTITLFDQTNTQFFERLYKKSREKAGRVKTDLYSYYVKGQYQGRISGKLKVIGATDSDHIGKHSGKDHMFIDRVIEAIKIPIKVLIVLRNPFDVIATRPGTGEEKDVYSKADRIFRRVKGVEYALSKFDEKNVYILRHEDFINFPEKHLREMCDFLEVEWERKYVKDCASIVYKEPHLTRFERSNKFWLKGSKKYIQDRIKEYGFLDGYTF